MRNTAIWSFLSLVALATAGLAVGCDSDEKVAKSAAGESCDNTSDCNDGLKCLDHTCYKSNTSSGGSSSNEGGDGTGATVTGPKPPVLGGPGETCTKRADCEDGLGCFSQRCQATGGGEGGAGTGGPTLGGPGETCGLTTDCSTGLRCLPQGDIFIDAIGSNSVGTCTPIDSGLTPTGKTCGHECAEAADCCELPLAQQVATGASSCSDLAALAADVPNCATAVGINGLVCLAYSAYCDDQCGANTWACEAGSCVYDAKCTKPTQVVGGCPAYTRGGNAIPTCDTKTSKCAVPAGVVAGCAKDADCDKGELVADHPTDTCSVGECTCHVASAGCYRKCSETLDCMVGWVCDDTSSLCVPQGQCTSDAICITSSGDVRAKCVEGACSVPCEHDIDCNPGGLHNGAFEFVCDAGKCVDLGCDSNEECSAYAGGTLHSFCAEPSTAAGGEVISSAITD